MQFPFQLQLTKNEIREVTNNVSAKFNLGADQNKLIDYCAGWFVPLNTTPRRTQINVGFGEGLHKIAQVNGVFGSGKTTLLVAICFLVDNLMYAHDAKCATLHPQINCLNGSKIRILLTSSTNRAVDNVMKSLLHRDFNSIARCGQLTNIARIVKNFHVSQHVIKNDTLARFVVLFSQKYLYIYYHNYNLRFASLLYTTQPQLM